MTDKRKPGASIHPARTGHVDSYHDKRPASVIDGLGLLAHGIGAVLMLVVIARSTFSGDTTAALETAELYAAATISALAGAILSSGLGALYLIVCYYFSVFTAIPAFVQIGSRQFPFGSSYTDAQLNAGFMVLAIGQLCLMLGFTAFRLRPRTPGMPTTPNTSAETPAPLSPLDAGQLARRLAASLALLATVLAIIAGPQQIFTARFDETASVSAVGSIGAQLTLIARAFALVGLLLGIVAVKTWPSHATARPPKSILLFTAIVAAVVNYPPALPRFQLLGGVLAVLVLLVNFRRRLIKILFTGGATLFVLYIFAAIKDLREGLAFDQFGRVNVGSYLTSVDFDSFKQVTDTVIYFSSAPFREGVNFLGVLLFWIPRSLWAGKPIHTGEVVSAGLGYPYTNVSNPLPAEGYASWGIVGTIVVMLVIGLVTARLEGVHNTAPQAQRSIPSLIGYALASGYATILLRGALGAIAPMIFSAFVLALVVHVLYRRAETRSRRPGSQRVRNSRKSR